MNVIQDILKITGTDPVGSSFEATVKVFCLGEIKNVEVLEGPLEIDDDMLKYIYQHCHTVDEIID